MLWSELGVSGGTALIVPCALYLVVKWAVRNGVMEAHDRIAGEKKGGLRTVWEAVPAEDPRPE